MKNKMRRINIIITVLALMLTLTAQKCYCEEPDAGKPHVRICEGLRV